VRPGDRLPLSPANRLTFSVAYATTSAWTIGGDVRYQSGQYFAGDQSNQEPKLPGHTTLDLHSSYQFAEGYTLFGEIENVFGKHYGTYGAFTELDGLPPSFNLNDPRTVSPAPGRLFFAGIRTTFR
jgi:iron complex outermembrane receptor protein